MMIIKKLEIDLETNTVSVLTQKQLFDKDGNAVGDRQNHRCAFMPEDMEQFKKHIGKSTGVEVEIMEKIWTPEVIEASKAKQRLEEGE